MSSKSKRRVTVDTGNAMPEDPEKRKPSVFERLGPGGGQRKYSEYETGSSGDREREKKCRPFLLTGECPYGATCKYKHVQLSRKSKSRDGDREGSPENLRLKLKGQQPDRPAEKQSRDSDSETADKSAGRSRRDKDAEGRDKSHDRLRRDKDMKIRSQVVVKKSGNAGSDDSDASNEESWFESLEHKKEPELEQKLQQLQRELSQLSQEEEGGDSVAVQKKAALALSGSDSSPDLGRSATVRRPSPHERRTPPSPPGRKKDKKKHRTKSPVEHDKDKKVHPLPGDLLAEKPKEHKKKYDEEDSGHKKHKKNKKEKRRSLTPPPELPRSRKRDVDVDTPSDLLERSRSQRVLTSSSALDRGVPTPTLPSRSKRPGSVSSHGSSSPPRSKDGRDKSKSKAKKKKSRKEAGNLSDDSPAKFKKWLSPLTKTLKLKKAKSGSSVMDVKEIAEAQEAAKKRSPSPPLKRRSESREFLAEDPMPPSRAGTREWDSAQQRGRSLEKQSKKIKGKRSRSPRAQSSDKTSRKRGDAKRDSLFDRGKWAGEQEKESRKGVGDDRRKRPTTPSRQTEMYSPSQLDRESPYKDRDQLSGRARPGVPVVDAVRGEREFVRDDSRHIERDSRRGDAMPPTPPVEHPPVDRYSRRGEADSFDQYSQDRSRFDPERNRGDFREGRGQEPEADRERGRRPDRFTRDQSGRVDHKMDVPGRDASFDRQQESVRAAGSRDQSREGRDTRESGSEQGRSLTRNSGDSRERRERDSIRGGPAEGGKFAVGGFPGDPQRRSGQWEQGGRPAEWVGERGEPPRDLGRDGGRVDERGREGRGGGISGTGGGRMFRDDSRESLRGSDRRGGRDVPPEVRPPIIPPRLDRGEGRMERGDGRSDRLEGRGEGRMDRGMERVEVRLERGDRSLDRGDGRMDRGERSLDRSDGRLERGDSRLERGDRMERPDRMDRPDNRMDRPGMDRPDRIDRPGMDRPEARMDRPDMRLDRPVMDRPDRMDRPDPRMDRPDNRMDRPGMDRPDRIDRPDNRMDRPDNRMDRTDNRMERGDNRMDRRRGDPAIPPPFDQRGFRGGRDGPPGPDGRGGMRRMEDRSPVDNRGFDFSRRGGRDGPMGRPGERDVRMETDREREPPGMGIPPMPIGALSRPPGRDRYNEPQPEFPPMRDERGFREEFQDPNMMRDRRGDQLERFDPLDGRDARRGGNRSFEDARDDRMVGRDPNEDRLVREHGQRRGGMFEFDQRPPPVNAVPDIPVDARQAQRRSGLLPTPAEEQARRGGYEDRGARDVGRDGRDDRGRREQREPDFVDPGRGGGRDLPRDGREPLDRNRERDLGKEPRDAVRNLPPRDLLPRDLLPRDLPPRDLGQIGRPSDIRRSETASEPDRSRDRDRGRDDHRKDSKPHDGVPTQVLDPGKRVEDDHGKDILKDRGETSDARSTRSADDVRRSGAETGRPGGLRDARDRDSQSDGKRSPGRTLGRERSPHPFARSSSADRHQPKKARSLSPKQRKMTPPATSSTSKDVIDKLRSPSAKSRLSAERRGDADAAPSPLRGGRKARSRSPAGVKRKLDDRSKSPVGSRTTKDDTKSPVAKRLREESRSPGRKSSRQPSPAGSHHSWGSHTSAERRRRPGSSHRDRDGRFSSQNRDSPARRDRDRDSRPERPGGESGRDDADRKRGRSPAWPRADSGERKRWKGPDGKPGEAPEVWGDTGDVEPGRQNIPKLGEVEQLDPQNVPRMSPTSVSIPVVADRGARRPRSSSVGSRNSHRGNEDGRSASHDPWAERTDAGAVGAINDVGLPGNPEATDDSKEGLGSMLDDDEYEEISSDEGDFDNEEDKQGQNIVSVLDIDWSSLAKEPAPKQTTGSLLKRFHPANIFHQIGVSRGLAGDTLFDKVKAICEEGIENGAEKKDSDEKAVSQTPTKLDTDLHSDVPILHMASVRQKRERGNLLRNLGPFRRALCARRDLEIRRQLCKVDKVYEQPTVFPTHVMDADLCKLSIQLFRQGRDFADRKDSECDGKWTS